jgi:hypothetical protein
MRSAAKYAKFAADTMREAVGGDAPFSSPPLNLLMRLEKRWLEEMERLSVAGAYPPKTFF